ncbi:hypothetical protein [Sinorhizobium medicae]|uniref:DUF927 domain-containing protein n=1 Tax=Sinorhizobium medicae TaxID=110321 RepID=A0A508WTC1_9HYPH|nr:hypothetical protein [Sinorhizobium medicae]MDX0524938.1 hypothetical protein [Sinorhizobium medicae]MDX0548603.1 hypothetical protein [Sinorhizobium medicae]MDX0772188.1 hypothetical protein [Sinorhizobium medicae]MDX0833519.1 hypothetical protein [Sinorhizobium medicae]VTZ60465.1 conserved hypothetical protein [Sinorhizobium medicae]
MAARKMDGGSGGGTRNMDRLEIQLRPGQYTHTAMLAEGAIADAKLPVYDRGGILVHPVEMDMKDEHNNTIKSVALQPITVPLMRQFMETAARFVVYNATTKKTCPRDPPAETAKLILARRGFWSFPRIVGVMTAQSIDRNGNIIDQEGVHRPSQMLFHGLPKLPPMPEHPTREDALASLEILKDLLTEFPFSDPEGKQGVSLSVALAALISPLCRAANPRDPLFAIHAPVAGTGKSYFCRLVSAILTGRACPVVAYAADEDEFRKRLDAALILGSPIISLDNCNGKLSSWTLCQALTEDVIQIRPLGTSNTIDIQSRTTWLANGNGITVTEDLTRRTVLIRLDSNEERPELREFAQHPFERIVADRGRYVAAALTIVRAYILAGRPGRLPPLASYEAWSANVRSALVWLDCADPCDSMNEIIGNDPEKQLLRALFEVWPVRNVDYTTAELIDIAMGKVDCGDKNAASELRQVIENIAPGKDGIDARKLGKFLGTHAYKVLTHPATINGEAGVGKLKLLKGKLIRGNQRWILSDRDQAQVD